MIRSSKKRDAKSTLYTKFLAMGPPLYATAWRQRAIGGAGSTARAQWGSAPRPTPIAIGQRIGPAESDFRSRSGSYGLACSALDDPFAFTGAYADTRRRIGSTIASLTWHLQDKPRTTLRHILNVRFRSIADLTSDLGSERYWSKKNAACPADDFRFVPATDILCPYTVASRLVVFGRISYSG
jgi:hypothetical protein